jgi:hypothetical protein
MPVSNNKKKIQEVLDLLDKRICIYCEKRTHPMIGLNDYSIVCDKHLLEARDARVAHGLTSLAEELESRGLLV